MNARAVSSSFLARSMIFASIVLFSAWPGDAPAQSSPSPYTYGTRYDLMGRVTGTIAPDPDGAGALLYQAVRNTYDDVGRLIKIESGQLSSWFSESTAPANWSGFTIYKKVEMSYNAQNQKTLELVKGSNDVATAATQYGYDNFGRLQCTAIRMNPAVYTSLPNACSLGSEGSFGPDRITKNHYNSRGELIKVQQAVGTSLEEDYATYTYSTNGNRTSVTDARGYKAAMEFDGVDRQSKWFFPLPTTPGTASSTDYEQYGYDANSNRTSLRKRDSSVLTYDFDALNRMWRKIVPERSGLDPSHTRDVYYGYDSFGRMTYANFDSAAGQGISTGYNGFSEVTSTSVSLTGLSASFTFLFDANGNRTRVTYADGNYVAYGYDGLDRPVSIQRSGSGSTTLATYTYHPRGARETMGGAFTTTYAYYPDGRLQTLTNTPAHPSYSAQYGFSYNPASQIIQQTRSNDLFAWTGATNANESYLANGLNQYTSAIGTAHSYDANGNLTSDGSTTYVYDVENRLVSASGAKNATLRYDPMGRLYETSGGVAGLTRFAYDGDALAQEFNVGGSLLRRYVHGVDPGDDPIAWFEGAGFTNTEQRLLRTDHQGSIVAVSDASSAGMHAVNSYDEYGIPSTANLGRFQYTGQTWMPELGLYYYKARMYSPKLGRFMQVDPIGYEDDVNLYAYVRSDPINKLDPTGKKGCASGEFKAGVCTSDMAAVKSATAGGDRRFRSENVNEMKAQMPDKSVGEQLVDAAVSYGNGIAAAASQAVARSGLLGAEAQDKAIMVNGDLHDAVQAVKENPTTAKEAAAAYAGKYPVQVAGRGALGPGLAIFAGSKNPMAGATLSAMSALSLYGNAVSGIQAAEDTSAQNLVRSVVLGGQ